MKDSPRTPLLGRRKAPSWLPLAVLIGLLSPHGLLAQGVSDPPTYQACPEFWVGEADGALVLTRVGQIVQHMDRVYVSQPSEQRIRVLSADGGGLIGELGGSGDGPGESRDLSWMGLFDDSLVVVDSRSQRITVFGVDGALIGTQRFVLPPASPPFVFGGWIKATRDGKLVVFGDISSRVSDPPETHPWLLATPEGRVLAELPPYRPRDRTVAVRAAGGSVTFSRPIHRADQFAMASDGSLLVQAGPGNGASLLVTVYRVPERRAEQWSLDVPPVIVPSEKRDSVKQGLRMALERRGLVRGLDRRELDEALMVPERVPAVDEIFVAEDGDIWLREPNFSESDDLWRVVDQQGTLVAVVSVPHGMVLRARAGDHLWGYRRDPDLDFVSIARLRIKRMGDGRGCRSDGHPAE